MIKIIKYKLISNIFYKVKFNFFFKIFFLQNFKIFIGLFLKMSQNFRNLLKIMKAILKIN